MVCLFQLSKIAMLGGTVVFFYGALQQNFLLILQGIIMIWTGFGVYSTFLQIQNNVHEE